MSGFAVARDLYDGEVIRRTPGWVRNYLRKVARVDPRAAVLAAFTAVQLRFGNNVTGAYVDLSRALPLFWLIALWAAGGYDVRFIGTGSDEARKVLNAGGGLTAAIAVFPYTGNLKLSRGYALNAAPTATLLHLISRYLIRKRLYGRRAVGRCPLSAADLAKEHDGGRDHRLTRVGSVQPDRDRRERPEVPDLQTQDPEN